MNSYSRVRTQSAEELKTAIAKQPVAVAVDASNWSQYRGGVFSNCGKNVNHAVLAVGYEGDDYWIIKNSWGKTWGSSGHIHLKGGQAENACDILSYPYIPNV